jgi:hypothetical protein
MKLLRTIPWFTRLLVGLFLVAQFAGMVSSPRVNAMPVTSAGASKMDAPHMDAPHMDASQAHHHHAQGHRNHGIPCDHRDCIGNPADACCALHACFAGLLPPVAAIATETIAGEPLAAGPDNSALGARGGRLERPPRPLH